MFLSFHQMKRAAERDADNFLRFDHVKLAAGEGKCFFVRTRKNRQYLVEYNGGFRVYKLDHMEGERLYVRKLTDHSVEVGEDYLLRLVYPSKWLIDLETRLIHLSDIELNNVFWRKSSSERGKSGSLDSGTVTCWFSLFSLLMSQ